MKRIAIPILIIALGLAWLLTVQGVLPTVSWPWTIGLALAGIFSFVYLGFNKVTFVAGTFFVLCSIFSLLRQTGRLELNLELPLLVICLGLLLFLAQVLPIPRPSWLLEDADISGSDDGAGRPGV
jgi:hypothetical protein